MDIKITKNPTRRDYVVALAKLYNIKGACNTTIVELLVKILNETLKDETQRQRAYESSIRGYDCDLTHDDWENITSTILSIIKVSKKEDEESLRLKVFKRDICHNAFKALKENGITLPDDYMQSIFSRV